MEWKTINYKGLEIVVSNAGDIKIEDFSVTYSDGRIYTYKGHIVKQYLDKRGYKICAITRNGKRYNIKVHRAVAMAFLPNPNSLPQVNHKDENKTNNFVWVNPDGSVDLEKSNLEWCSNIYNHNYGTINDRISKSNGHPVLCMSTGVIYPSYNDARKQMGHPNSTCIRDCCNGRQKTAYGMQWKWA